MDIEKKVTNKKGWFYIAVGGLIISLISMLFPVINYSGMNFTAYDMITENRYFDDLILNDYHGPVLWDLTAGTVSVLAIVAVAALLLAILGLVTLRAQRPNTINFILTIIGLLGIAVPSITVIFSVLVLGKYYSGDLTLGIAPIISPIAIIISIFAVIRRKNRVAEEIRKEVERKGLIWKAGDL